MSVINGSAAFINLAEHELYQGQSSPDGGEPQSQRKFASKFDVPVYEANGDEFMGNVTRGSHVRVQYSLGQEHPVHGITPYLDKIKVLELASGDTDEDF